MTREDRFFAAWKHGCELAGVRFFGDGTLQHWASAKDKWDLKPNHELIKKEIGCLSSGEKKFLAGMYSFFNPRDGEQLLDENLTGVGRIAAGCDSKRCVVIAGLLANYIGW